jgi:membrane associated rhomboid family serine protease
MERLLSRLERHFGRFAISGLPMLIVAGMAIVLVLGMLQPAYLAMLELDIPRVFGRGGARFPEVWRLVTYLFLPRSMSPIWAFFQLWWTWFVLSNLESAWGAFKLNAFYLVGMLGTTAAAVIVGGAEGNVWLTLSAFLALATIYPDYEILVFFVLPLKLKWIALLSVAPVAISFFLGGWDDRAAILAGFTNYFLFCGGILVDALRGRRIEVRQAARRANQVAEKRDSARPTGGRVCAICGAKEDDGADIRVCSCEKCGGKPRTLCLEHARNH